MDVREFVKKLYSEGEKQVDIARKSGVSQGTIYKLLYTDTRPTLDIIYKISKAYRVDLDNPVSKESLYEYKRLTLYPPLLEEVIEELETYLDNNDLEMQSDKKARLICLLYEEFEEEKKIDKERALRLIRTAA